MRPDFRERFAERRRILWYYLWVAMSFIPHTVPRSAENLKNLRMPTGPAKVRCCCMSAESSAL